MEVTEFSQVTSDGKVAADCSSGVCECAEGFKDFGDGLGCEPGVMKTLLDFLSHLVGYT